MATRVAVPLAAAAVVSMLASPAATAATTAARTPTSAGICYENPCITGIRAATHPDYDRLVFDLTSSVTVTGTSTNTTGEYTPMSGKPEYLDVPGTSYLFVTMEPVYTATDLNLAMVLSLPTIKGVQLTNYHAARGQFGISLGPSTRYNIFQLTQPNRLVIDVYR
ncbi:hypothetical protein [Streptomyces sp. NBC_00572]|uniref:AMIN-like domain-containing (lipo)protein n=1 Tax=Streptomyces sp. NBC_00572 TaxID=2903664 RepID=UPI00225813F5|nr:hypothetical protein [Streptomyces sp. NBC_00572]MCX4984322.1 hypothetical protein [Streptomyces sp. NBC_00572]